VAVIRSDTVRSTCSQARNDTNSSELFQRLHAIPKFGPLSDEEREAAHRLYSTLLPRVGFVLEAGAGTTSDRSVEGMCPFIAALDPSGAASAAGLLVNDIVLEFNNERINFSKQFTSVLSSLLVGSMCSIKICRNKKDMVLSFRIGASGYDTKDVSALHDALFEPQPFVARYNSMAALQEDIETFDAWKKNGKIVSASNTKKLQRT
jgi:hypothetical protein